MSNLQTAFEIALQPKQSKLLSLIKQDPAPVIGVGGGRGAAKSSGADRCIITLMYEQSSMLACMVMRNFDQVFKYHIEPIRRDFPWLETQLKTSMPASLRVGGSQLDFSYAENMDDIIRRFRSGNYDLIVIDQAEQFSGREIREIRKATRSRGGRTAKIVLLFNMRGSGIQDLRRWFHLHEVNKDEDPNDYKFLKVNPWDNVEWVRAALKEDGYTVVQYYSWPDDRRKEYAARRGPYTRQLATDDEVIRKADWDGDWDSLEGSYFANSFDLESTRIPPALVEAIRKPQSAHWLAQDWGKSHFCVTGWFFRTLLSPSEAKQLLGWDLVKPIKVTVEYRELVVNEMEAPNVAQTITDCTPTRERNWLKNYFLSPECVTEDMNCIGNQQQAVLYALGMPNPTKADNERKGGYGLLASLFQAAKGKGWGVDKEGNPFQYEDAMLISSECAESLAAIPALLRNPKDLDDVMKTDLTAAKIEQDCGDMLRYGTKSMLAPRKKTHDEQEMEVQAKITDPSALHFRRLQETERRAKANQPLNYWE